MAAAPLRQVLGDLDPLMPTRMLADGRTANRVVHTSMQSSVRDLRIELALSALLYDSVVVSDRWLFENSSLRTMIREAEQDHEDGSGWIQLLSDLAVVAIRPNVNSLAQLAKSTAGTGGAPSPGTRNDRERRRLAGRLDEHGIRLEQIATAPEERRLFADVFTPGPLASILGTPRADAVLAAVGNDETAPTRTSLMGIAVKQPNEDVRHDIMTIAVLVSQQALATVSGAILNPPKLPPMTSLNFTRFLAQQQGTDRLVIEYLVKTDSVTSLGDALSSISPKRLLALRKTDEFAELWSVRRKFHQKREVARSEQKALERALDRAFSRLYRQQTPDHLVSLLVSGLTTSTGAAVQLVSDQDALLTGRRSDLVLAAIATLSFVVAETVQGLQMKLRSADLRRLRGDDEI